MTNRRKFTIVMLVLAVALTVDQLVKFWVKTHMAIGDYFLIFGLKWAQIHFIENEGMAFGLKFGGDYGKLILTITRLITVGFLFYFLAKMIKDSKYPIGAIVAITLITAGAIGNIIDSVFYGIVFSESTPLQVAELFPEEGGYAPMFFGKVVDMFYFPFYNGRWPEWVPFMGGKRLAFFAHIFNVADSCITVGISIVLLWYRKLFFR